MKKAELISLFNMLVLVVTFSLIGCGDDNDAIKKNRLIILTDVSASAEFTDSIKVHSYLRRNLQNILGNQIKDIRIQTGQIGNGQNLFDSETFANDYPKLDGDITDKTKISQWQAERDSWIDSMALLFTSKAVSKGHDSSTDVFYHLEQIEKQKQLLHDEELFVLILSDMIHDKDGFDLRKINADDARKLGREEYVKRQTTLTKQNIEKIQVFINFPDKSLPDYAKIQQFWEAFFTEWGIKFSYDK